MEKLTIPKKSIYRISIYLRCLGRLIENEIETVSSTALAKAAGVKPAQLRKDIAHFGQFGTRGLGYSVKDLYSEIKSAMGGSNYHRVILVGVGNLGSALLRYQGFMREGYQVVSSFDAVPQAVITKGLPVPVLAVDQMEPYIRENQIKIAILCVPREQAQEVTNELVAAGITGILNFSSSVLIAPDHVTISCVDLALELENLSYFVS